MSIARHNPTLQRVLAAAVAFAYLLTYLGTYLHMMEEKHVVCEEHGHLVHAEDHGEKPVVEDDWEGSRLIAFPTHDDHDHCAEAFVFEAKRILAQNVMLPPMQFVELGAANADLVVLPPIRGPTQDILRFAPKTSPPHV
jgi:hypothetical protein